MQIKARNTLQNNAPKTLLSSAMSSGTTTISVKNVNGFTNGWGVQVGDIGEEKTEIAVISSSPSAGTFGISSGLSYNHPADTPLYAIKFDQTIFKRSTTGTAGTASAITYGTVTIQADADHTIFDDTSGSTSYAYKASYYSTGLASESPDSDWLTPSGYTFYSRAKLIERAKEKLFSAGYLNKDESQVGNWLNEWMESMNNAAVNVNKSYGIGTVNVTFGASGLGTITSTDYQELKKMDIVYNGVDEYRATKMDLTSFGPKETFNASHPYYYWVGDNVFGIKPVESGGTAIIHYYKTRTVLENAVDELPVVMRPYTRSFVDYCVGEAYYNDGKEGLGDRYASRAEGQRKEFVNMITPRNKGGINMITMTDPVDSDDGTWEAR